MAATGKKINELNSISTVTNETVLPAVLVQGTTPNSTANKISIEQLKNNFKDTYYTEAETNILLNQKQDKLTAGDNIIIEEDSDENLVISATIPNTVVQSNVAKTIVQCTQAEYDALTPDANTLYLIIEGSN